MHLESNAIKNIETICKKFDLKKSRLGEAAGYKGASSSQSSAYQRIVTKKTELSISHLNGMAKFLDLPAGFFLFNNKESIIYQIDQNKIIAKVKKFLEQEDKKPKTQRKTRTQFGKHVGYAEDETSQFNTASRILKGRSTIKIHQLEKIADFLEISITDLLS